MKYLIDSSFYISSLDETDPYFGKSNQILLSLGEHKVVTPTLVVAEVINAISKIHPQIVKTVYKNLLQNEVVNLDRSLIQSYFRRLPLKRPLKASDLIIAVTAASTKSTLITWDKQFFQAAHHICDVVDPLVFL